MSYVAVLSKRERRRESQDKIERKTFRRKGDEGKGEAVQGKKEGSKSKSRSKGMSKSKSMKRLVKKSKSMVRLEPRREVHREERKS